MFFFQNQFWYGKAFSIYQKKITFLEERKLENNIRFMIVFLSELWSKKNL